MYEYAHDFNTVGVVVVLFAAFYLLVVSILADDRKDRKNKLAKSATRNPSADKISIKCN